LRVFFDGEEKVEAVAGGMAMEVITDGDESPPHRLDHRDERVDVSSSSVLYPVCSMMLLAPVKVHLMHPLPQKTVLLLDFRQGRSAYRMPGFKNQLMFQDVTG